MTTKTIWPSHREMEVLRILQSEASGMYGLQIVEKSDGAISRASIYVLLGRLEEKGFVKVSKTTASHPGMPRPIYAITGLGQRVLVASEMVGITAVGT